MQCLIVHLSLQKWQELHIEVHFVIKSKFFLYSGEKKTFFQPPFHLTSATRVLVVYNYRTIVVYKKNE